MAADIRERLQFRYGCRYVTSYNSPAGMTNAERQRRYRERRAAGEPVRTVVQPKDRRPRPKPWADAVDQLRTLQADYEAWRDQLPESLADSRTGDGTNAC